MKIPNGREAVNEFYGNPSDGNGHLSSAWENANIVSITLPYPMRLAWDKSVMVSRIRIHHLAAPAFLAAFNAVWLQVRIIIKERDGYDETTVYYDAESRRYLASKNLDLYGGAFNFRAIRGASGLSMHSYGIAID